MSWAHKSEWGSGCKKTETGVLGIGENGRSGQPVAIFDNTFVFACGNVSGRTELEQPSWAGVGIIGQERLVWLVGSEDPSHRIRTHLPVHRAAKQSTFSIQQ